MEIKEIAGYLTLNQLTGATRFLVLGGEENAAFFKGIFFLSSIIKIQEALFELHQRLKEPVKSSVTLTFQDTTERNIALLLVLKHFSLLGIFLPAGHVGIEVVMTGYTVTSEQIMEKIAAELEQRYEQVKGNTGLWEMAQAVS